jgi:hypothetical protein
MMICEAVNTTFSGPAGMLTLQSPSPSTKQRITFLQHNVSGRRWMTQGEHTSSWESGS